MIKIRHGRADDRDSLLTLLPSLADFELPNGRVAEHLWQSDAALLQAHLQGDDAQTRLLVADDGHGGVVGLSLISLREEILSHEPSAHLEAIVVSSAARGQGLGRRLLQATERLASELGARSITLHAFRSNKRARALYESSGYDPELYRYTKPLTPDDDASQ